MTCLVIDTDDKYDTTAYVTFACTLWLKCIKLFTVKSSESVRCRQEVVSQWIGRQFTWQAVRWYQRQVVKPQVWTNNIQLVTITVTERFSKLLKHAVVRIKLKTEHTAQLQCHINGQIVNVHHYAQYWSPAKLASVCWRLSVTNYPMACILTHNTWYLST